MPGQMPPPGFPPQGLPPPGMPPAPPPPMSMRGPPHGLERSDQVRCGDLAKMHPFDYLTPTLFNLNILISGG